MTLSVPKKSDILDPALQEAKEAVADALVSLVADRVTGTGQIGLEVLGRLPKQAFVSGFLLPRYASSGEDETSDIHVSVLGIDTQVRAGASGTLTVVPQFALYVRVLPEWSDLAGQLETIAARFSLTPQVRQQLSARAAVLRKELRAAAGLPESIKESDKAKKKAAFDKLREIHREAYQRARAELGLPRLTSESSFKTAPLLPDSTPRLPGEGDVEGESAPEAPVIAGDTLKSVLACPPGVLTPIDIPQKWRRIQPDLPSLEVDLKSSAQDLAAILKTYNQALEAALKKAYSTWLASDAGKASTWRDAFVVPSDLKDEAAWKAFLDRLRVIPVDAGRCEPCVSNVFLDVSRLVDFSDPSRSSLRIALENANAEPGRSRARQQELSVFQVELEATLPTSALVSLNLDRIDPSYRFRDYLSYPAMGLNCGVSSVSSGDRTTLRTTSMPRWVQPRLVPTEIEIERRFSGLAKPSFDVASLLKLPEAYRAWIERAAIETRKQVAKGLSGTEREREVAAFTESLEAQRREADLIEKGIRLLVDSRKAALALRAAPPADRKSLEAKAAAYLAWLYTNEAFAGREKADENRGWRLFQLAFVLAHLPNVASRQETWAQLHEGAADEGTASLLYFPTGGGKSEAFYGTLVFAMFFDRLRGKNRGVTGLVRYPLRLLTLQQAQRFLKLLVHAELVRRRRKVGTWPFEIGFWVGGRNTPNRVEGFTTAIPNIAEQDDPDDERLKAGLKANVRRSRLYFQDLESYNKVPNCPVCGAPTGLRRLQGRSDDDRRVGIVCFSSAAACAWNECVGGPNREPLPFLLSDDTIYQRAPSVILGTIDKLALLGQHMSTILKVLGMFGLARWMLPSGHLLVPRSSDALSGGPEAADARPLFPAYRGGDKVFFDPFPSLIVQDEGHLLEESLGTFAGLFETLLETLFERISDKYQQDLGIATWLDNGRRMPRLPRLIMATATVSNPERQLETLYQRRPRLFPSPGHDIWRSFFAEPAPPPPGNPQRAALEKALPLSAAPEATAPWMRLYASLMTNGSNHTVTTVSVISAFHVEMTILWRGLLDPARRSWAVDRLKSAIRGPGAEWRLAALERLFSAGRFDQLLALLDLHRVSITYVTNKKGGDQIIDALDSFTRGEHARSAAPIAMFPTRLISGGVDMRDIQEVMRLCEEGFPPGQAWPDVESPGLLRNVVATSAISHGVDVDRFNSMFFAGLPSDVAEYIQASSRVGRTHVGFIILVPTPQSRRDRYVAETHDIYHRFLERMIAAPASERWAENAIHRVAASFIQAYLALREAGQFADQADDKKSYIPLDVVPVIEQLALRDKVKFGEECAAFALRASGLSGRGDATLGRPFDPEHYRTAILSDVYRFIDDILSAGTSAALADFWKERTISKLAPPMTSLRDVDEAAFIKGSRWSEVQKKSVDPEDLYLAMRVVRGQRFARSETEADVDDTKGLD